MIISKDTMQTSLLPLSTSAILHPTQPNTDASVYQSLLLTSQSHSLFWSLCRALCVSVCVCVPICVRVPICRLPLIHASPASRLQYQLRSSIQPPLCTCTLIFTITLQPNYTDMIEMSQICSYWIKYLQCYFKKKDNCVHYRKCVSCPINNEYCSSVYHLCPTAALTSSTSID